MRAQELYNQYCRKQISVNDFLYHVRRDPILKEYISPVNSAEDVITILKQRVGLAEQVTAEDVLIQEKEVASEEKSGEDLPNEPEFGEELEEGSSDDEEKYNEIDEKYGTPEIRDILANNDQLGFDFVGEAMNAILLEKNFDFADVSPEDVSKLKAWRTEVIRKAKSKPSINEAKKVKLTADDVNYYEFTKGWRWEYEKNPTWVKDQNIDAAKEKAIKNLATNPIYYTDFFSKASEKKQSKDPVNNKTKILKAPTDQVEIKDKVNQMKNAKKKDPVKSNVKTNMGNQERAKGAPKGVKVMKLKEAIRSELKTLLKENAAYNNHLEGMRDMVKMKPEELAKQVLAGKLPMSGMRKEFAAKVLGKHVADGNTSSDVKQAFHKLSSNVNEDVDKKIAEKAEKLIKVAGSKEKAIAVCDKAIKEAERETNKEFGKRLADGYKKVKAYIDGQTKEPVKADLNTFSTNERTSVSDIDTWKASVIDSLKKVLKTDDKAAGKIYTHYQKDFTKSHESGKDASVAVKDFFKGIKKVKEEFSGNTPPEKTDFVDTEIDQ